MKSKIALAVALLAVLVSGCTKHADPVVVASVPAQSAESIQREHDAKLEAMTPWQLIDEARPYAIRSMHSVDPMDASKASLEFTMIGQVFERKLKSVANQDEMMKASAAWVVMTSDAMTHK